MSHFAMSMLLAFAVNSPVSQDQQPTSEELRQAAIKWLDEYVANTALFRPQDVEAIRKKVEKMTPAELDQWVKKTQQLRQVLESDRWLATDKWLKEFLKVQAIYSDEEIEDLRKRAGQMSPSELIQLLEEIEQKHKQMTWMHSVSRQNQAAQVQAAQNTIKAQASAAKKRTYSGGSRPLFGASQAKANHKSKYPNVVPPPLITSRQVARGVVRREVLGGFGRGYRW